MWEFACRCRPGDTPIVLILLGGGGDALMASLVTVVPRWPGHALTARSCMLGMLCPCQGSP